MENKNQNMIFKLQKYCLSLVAGMLLIVSNGDPASAQISITVKNPNPYTGNQSWFVYQKRPGQIIEDIATIKNFGKETEKVKVYAVDATSNADGNFVLTFSNQKQESIGAWTQIEEKELTLKPGERVDVPFTISIPSNVTPSEYVGGIVAESDKSGNDCKEAACASSISVKTRVGSRIYITVPGVVKDNISWTDFQLKERSNGKMSFYFRIENKGNVTYKPRATIEILDNAGNVFDTIEKTLGESLPHTTFESNVMWNKEELPFLANFQVEARVEFIKSFKNSNELHSAAPQKKILQFWIIPWRALELTMLLIASFGVSFIISKRNYRKLIAHCHEYEVEENENIGSIAGKYHISWQRLAKINKLTAPYILTKGQKILVPGRTEPEGGSLSKNETDPNKSQKP